MADPPEDMRAVGAGEVAEITGEAEEEDESGAPERVAETDREHPLDSAQAIRQPRDESGKGESYARSVARRRLAPSAAHFGAIEKQGRQGSNLRPLVLETSALPAELRPSVRRRSVAPS